MPGLWTSLDKEPVSIRDLEYCTANIYLVANNGDLGGIKLS